MYFSVIIPTCNRPELLKLCLDALEHNRASCPEKFETIVSDDGTRTVEHFIAESYQWVKWIKGPRKGPAANRNNGAKHANGKWLVFIDDDCIPQVNLLKEYHQYILLNPEVKVLEGKTFVDAPRKSLSETSPLNMTGGYLWSCNFAILNEVFTKLMGFNESYPYAAMEDVDLRLRIIKSGSEFKFVPLASVMHPWRDKGGWKKIKEHQKSTFVYLSLHPGEAASINSRYYLEKTLRQLLKFTIPGMFRYKFRGVNVALMEHIGDLQMSFLLLFKR